MGARNENTYPYWPWVFPFLPLSLFNTLVLLLISGLPPMSRKTTYTERACFCCHCTYPSHTHLPPKVIYYENVFIHYTNSGSERVIWMDKRRSSSADMSVQLLINDHNDSWSCLNFYWTLAYYMHNHGCRHYSPKEQLPLFPQSLINMQLNNLPSFLKEKHIFLIKIFFQN